jgi:capsular polysaccharide transport system permease protein
MQKYIDGAITQLRVVHALILRETRTRFGMHRLGYIWALLEPIIWIMTFYGLYTIGGRVAPNGMDIIAFLATGIVTYEVFAKTADRGAAAIAANKAMLFYPHVHPLDLSISRAALEISTYVTVFLILVGTHALVIQSWSIDSALRTAMGLGLAGLLGASLGLLFCSLAVVATVVDRIRGPLMRPLFWVSGLFFTANGLPSDVRKAMLYNPVMHCIEIVRDGWFPSYHADYASANYVLLWVIGLSFFGLTLERAVRTRVEVT